MVLEAALSPDPGGTWTRRIWAKYLDGITAPGATDRLRGRQRVLITPRHLLAVASV